MYICFEHYGEDIQYYVTKHAVQNIDTTLHTIVLLYIFHLLLRHNVVSVFVTMTAAATAVTPDRLLGMLT